MKTLNRFVATAGILLALVSLSFIPAAAQSYTVTDLGTLNGIGNSGSSAINETGEVIGWSTAQGSSGYHCFVWSQANGMEDLGFLDVADDECFAYGINKAGEVVGYSFGVTTWGGFLWTQSEGMIDIGSLGGGVTQPYAINDSEQVVGTSLLADGITQHAFLWTRSGGMQDLGSLAGGSYSVARAVNDAGQVTGYSVFPDNVTVHAFLWTQSNGMQDLGTLGGSYSYAYGINSLGQVTGFSSTSSEVRLSFLWSSAHGMTALGAKKDVDAFSINAAGQIVGLSEDDQLGFLWTKAHRYQNLNGMMPHTFGLIDDAIAINNKGQIAGNSDKFHALLLTPTK